MDTYSQPVPAKRRRWELEQKLRVVQETLVAGASVAQIARMHGLNANLVFNWRRLYQAGRLGGRRENKLKSIEGRRELLLPVRVTAEDMQPSAPDTSASIASSLGMIHIQLREVQVRVEGNVDPGLVRVILECLAR